MKTTFRRILLIAAVIAGAGIILFVASNAATAFAHGGSPFGRNSGMMGGNGNNPSTATGIGGMMGFTGTLPHGSGMMGGDATQQMMGSTGVMSNGANMMNGGMMGFTGTLQSSAMPGGMSSMMSGGMMMGFGSNSLLGVKPLSVDQVTSAVHGYLTKQGNKDLTLAEVVIFDNNAYARITEKSTGAGAFELFVNPVTLAVYPEPGPNMMWNTKYSPMRATRSVGGATGEATTVMPVSASDALKTAQTYLDKNLPGAKTAADADTFYGYYTIDILRDGKVAGMLGVNGYTSAVFLHTWHGNFIEMSAGR